MTQSTEKERVGSAVFKQLLDDYKQCLLNGDLYDAGAAHQALVAEYEQASRRTQVVSEGWKLVPMEPTPEQLLKVYKQTGVSRKELADLWTAMLAAAPQPPEADSLKSEKRTTKPDAATVQLPEPDCFAFQHSDGTWHDVSHTRHSAGMKSLHTEQKVRQLLAEKGKND